MKKYILFSFSLIFVFTLFNINVHFVRANDEGCTSLGPYNTITGKLCEMATTGNVNCPTGDIFNALTGERCTEWQDNSSNYAGQEFKMWSRGENVRQFQQVLKDGGFLSGKVDGIYGPITDGAARRYYRACPPEQEGPHIMMKYKFCLPQGQGPVISGVSGPQTLDVNQEGTWIVTAQDPKGGTLSYSVVWGDEGYAVPMENSATGSVVQQSATFTHSYAQGGVYAPRFTVANSNGQSAKTSLSVNVGGVIIPNQTPAISSISPTSGIVDSQVTIIGSGFTPTDNKIKFGDTNSENNPEYNLSPNNIVCFRYPCPSSITFTVPSTYYIPCLNTTPACKVATKLILPGAYDISVINENGASNAISFTVNPTNVQY